MMATNPYQVLGPSVPQMLGRSTLRCQIDRHLRKETPDHVSVVGPSYYGKSVLLRHIADSYGTGAVGYVAASYIDLRRGVPASDCEFMRRFEEEVKAALWNVHPELAHDIDEYRNVGGLLGPMLYVFNALEEKGERLLAVLDGFDYALAGTGLTRNLWDQLRTLAQKDSLRFVTGSRRRLLDLCHTEESRTSDFWNIFFDGPISVAALEDADLEAFLKPLLDAGCKIDGPAPRKEVANWTGGVPLLVSALMQRLWDDYHGEHLSPKIINQAAKAVLVGRRQLLDALWDDCDNELRTDVDALSRGDISLTEIAGRRRRTLVERGFGRESRNLMHGSCRLIQLYARDQAPVVADLTRLVGTAAGFGANVQSLLKLRLAQVSAPPAAAADTPALGAVDEKLRDFVSLAIRDLAPVPERAMIWARNIAERALQVVWEAEGLPTDRTLPEKWTEEWDKNGVRYPRPRGTSPLSRGEQCSILRLATGTDRTIRCTRFLTKPTFLLLDHLQSVGNFGQHRGDGPEVTVVTVGFAAAVLSSAISLLECLASDLAGAAHA